MNNFGAFCSRKREGRRITDQLEHTGKTQEETNLLELGGARPTEEYMNSLAVFFDLNEDEYADMYECAAVDKGEISFDLTGLPLSIKSSLFMLYHKYRRMMYRGRNE